MLITEDCSQKCIYIFGERERERDFSGQWITQHVYSYFPTTLQERTTDAASILNINIHTSVRSFQLPFTSFVSGEHLAT